MITRLVVALALGLLGFALLMPFVERAAAAWHPVKVQPPDHTIHVGDKTLRIGSTVVFWVRIVSEERAVLNYSMFGPVPVEPKSWLIRLYAECTADPVFAVLHESSYLSHDAKGEALEVDNEPSQVRMLLWDTYEGMALAEVCTTDAPIFADVPIFSRDEVY